QVEQRLRRGAGEDLNSTHTPDAIDGVRQVIRVTAIKQQSKLQNMHVVYIYLAILGFSGLFFDWLLVQARRRLCPWFGE
ncbi:MAG: hypothetical protein SFV81_28415, partial [Pirellulaceae bacterium]|nr:hypothetical protein [Pirellulaceae bacterium]